MDAIALTWLLVAVSGGCTSPTVTPPPGPAPVETTRDAIAEFPNWPIPPLEAERVLAEGDLTVLSERYAGRGLTGASRVELRAAGHPESFSAKWKPMPAGLDGINNAPRKELAAYQIQRILLEPSDYVVPTSVARCMPPEAFPVPGDHHSTLPGSSCELGIFSLWLEDVTLPDTVLDEMRFRNDSVYAYHFSNFNLITYLLKHQDGRYGNFLVSRSDGGQRLFSIDNGVAFGGIWYNWFVPNWKHLRAPALRRASIDRLRALQPADLAYLRTVARFERLPDGSWVPTEAVGVLAEDYQDGVRIEDDVVELGLDEDEIDDIWERIQDLIEDVDDGDHELF